MDKVTEILEERKQQYGETWLDAGRVIFIFQDMISSSRLFKETELFHNWVMLLSKLFRMLHSPLNIDHVQDIQGYAKLCEKYILKMQELGYHEDSV